MKLEITVEDQATPFVKVFFHRHLPFVNSLALNNTLKDVQNAQRARLGEVFTLRRKQWAERSIKITQFATKTRPEARIAVEAPGDKSRSDILGKFETDTAKRPTSGEHVAVPVEARRSRSGIVQARDRPRRAIDEGRAFVRKIGGKSFIFERLKTRTAKKFGKALRLLYSLVHSVPIKPELEFEKTAERIVPERWPVNFRAAFERAIRTAR